MIDGTFGYHQTGSGTLLPYVEQGGRRRILAKLPTPRDHPARGRLSFPRYAAESGLPDVDPASVRPFDYRRPDVPIRDQGSQSSCVANAAAAGCEVLRAAAGDDPVRLSASDLYTKINGGFDRGSNPGDAVDALTTLGIAPDSAVPDGTISPPGYSDPARKQALRYVLADVVRVRGFGQAVVAAYFGFYLIFDVCVGNRFGPDGNGFIAPSPGQNNHEMGGGEAFGFVAGRPALLVRQSWGIGWGMDGFCWAGPDVFDRADDVYALRYFRRDPDDPTDPPPVR